MKIFAFHNFIADIYSVQKLIFRVFTSLYNNSLENVTDCDVILTRFSFAAKTKRFQFIMAARKQCCYCGKRIRNVLVLFWFIWIFQLVLFMNYVFPCY